MQKVRKLRIPLYINILTVFLIIIAFLMAGVLGYSYRKNSEAALLSADQVLTQMGESVSERTQKMFDEALLTVKTLTNSRNISVKPSIHSHPLSRMFFEFLELHPNFTALYIGFDDGDFYLVSSLKGRDTLKKSLGAPSNTAWYTQRIVHRKGEGRYQIKRYLDKGYVTVGSSVHREDSYDPRRRPWYKSAKNTDKLQLSDIYLFSLSGEPGITVSRRFDGEIPGVFGTDISLDKLSAFLKEQNIGDRGRIMIFDKDATLYGYPDLSKRITEAVGNNPNGIATPKIGSFSTPVAKELYAELARNDYKDLKDPHITVDGTPYLAHVTQLSTRYGKPLYVGLAVPQDTYTGPIARIGEQTLIVSLGILCVFLPIILWAARRISSPLNSLTKSVDQITSFQLETPVNTQSQIIEVRNLSAAVETMRGALKAFGSYIPRPLVETMIMNRITPMIGGEHKELTFLFTDIADFTSISEQLAAEEITRDISGYFKEMSSILLENKGTIDKYIGDAIMAFWNAPVETENHAVHACRAALQCHIMLNDFNAKRRQEGKAEFHTRIGLHTAEAVVGNVGSADRMDYTAMGAAVNLASRIEGLNKYLGTSILVSEATANAAQHVYCFRFAGRVVPKGATTPIAVYELLDSCDKAITCPRLGMGYCPNEKKMIWENCIEQYFQRDFHGALECCTKILDLYGDDALVEGYQKLAIQYIADPPGEDWNGVLHFDAK